MRYISWRRKRSSDASIAGTTALIQQALHDTYSFNKRRFQRIEEQVETYSHEIEHSPETFSLYRQRLEDKGIQVQMLRDFIRSMQKGIEVSGKAERLASEAAIEYTYTLMFLAIAELFKFGRERLQTLQKRIKLYTWCIRDGDVMVPEFMKCMAIECGQVHTNIDDWERVHGELRIYG